MQRDELLQHLATVSPALAANDRVPLLTQFWFTGTALMAYNDQIGISVPVQTPFTGGVPKQLHGLLDSSNAETLRLAANGESLTLGMGRGNYTLPLQPAESFMQTFTMPDSATVRLDEARRTALAAALECCLRSVSSDNQRPEYMGVTWTPGAKVHMLFATDGATLTSARVGADGWPPLREPVILPREFCEQVLRLMQGASEVAMGIHADHALLVADQVTLFGRLIISREPLDYVGLLRKNFPPNQQASMVAIPDDLMQSVQRAVIIAEGAEKPRTRFTVQSGRLEIKSRSALGEGHDIVPLPQPDADVTTNPKLVRRGIEHYEKILIRDACIVLMARNQIHLIARYEGRDQS